MATGGDEFANPAGGRLRFRRTARDSSGEVVEVETVYPPRSPVPRAHYHPSQEERFQIVQGELRTRIGDTERTYRAGEAFVVRPNVRHWMHNAGDVEAHVIWETRPALKTEAFFEALWGLGRDGKMNARGAPNILRFAVIAREYQEEFRLA